MTSLSTDFQARQTLRLASRHVRLAPQRISEQKFNYVTAEPVSRFAVAPDQTTLTPINCHHGRQVDELLQQLERAFLFFCFRGLEKKDHTQHSGPSREPSVLTPRHDNAGSCDSSPATCLRYVRTIEVV